MKNWVINHKNGNPRKNEIQNLEVGLLTIDTEEENKPMMIEELINKDDVNTENSIKQLD